VIPVKVITKEAVYGMFPEPQEAYEGKLINVLWAPYPHEDGPMAAVLSPWGSIEIEPLTMVETL
jgi:hypothetical protein